MLCNDNKKKLKLFLVLLWYSSIQKKGVFQKVFMCFVGGDRDSENFYILSNTTNKTGSAGKIRTYNQVVNSHLLYH